MSVVYIVGYAKNMLHFGDITVLLARKCLNIMLLTTFENLDRLHFQDFRRNTRFLSFDGPTNYVHLFNTHKQKFLWPGKYPSSYFKVIKILFAPNIKYLSEPFFTDFCLRKDISCFFYKNGLLSPIQLSFKQVDFCINQP